MTCGMPTAVPVRRKGRRWSPTDEPVWSKVDREGRKLAGKRGPKRGHKTHFCTQYQRDVGPSSIRWLVSWPSRRPIYSNPRSLPPGRKSHSDNVLAGTDARQLDGGIHRAFYVRVRSSHMDYADPAIEQASEPRIGRSVSLDHAAQLLGVSRRTIYNRIRDGRLQTIRTVGGSQRVLIESVRGWRGIQAEPSVRRDWE